MSDPSVSQPSPADKMPPQRETGGWQRGSTPAGAGAPSTAPGPSLVPATVSCDARGLPETVTPTQPSVAVLRPVPAVAGYELAGLLGQGGMGVVYRARHLRLNRWVALKMIRDGLLATADQLDRFRIEARAVARLQHPNIIQIFEVGEQEGRPYLTLELAEGGSLAQQLAGQPLPPREAARLVGTLARATHHAHLQGVVHRDLKPANILLAGGVPKISDFGLAKQTEAEVFLTHTRTNELLGTPSYMAPEQAWGKNREVGPAADVYALGAILYELLTGQPPFRADSLMEVLDQVRTRDPIAPRRWQPQCPRDLETICLKCLQKDPRKRYGTAEELADDLRRFEAGEPIYARPVRLWEKGLKWVRRRPAVAALAAVSVLAAVLVAAGALVARRAADQQQQSERALLAASYPAKIREAAQALDARQDSEAEALLEACPQELRGWEWHYLRRRRVTPGAAVLPAESSAVMAVAFGSEGVRLATGCRDGSAAVWDCATGKRTFQALPQGLAVLGASFRPDGRRLAVATGADWLNLLSNNSRRPERIGKMPKSSPQRWLPPPPQGARSSGLRVAAQGGRGARSERKRPVAEPARVTVWDLADGEVVLSFAAHDILVASVAFSPDGKWLASAGQGWKEKPAHLQGNVVLGPAGGEEPRTRPLAVLGEVKVWDAATGQQEVALSGHGILATAVAFHPDGRLLAAAGADGDIRLWDWAARQQRRLLRGHAGVVTAVAFSPDGTRLASAGADRTVRLWDTDSGRHLAALQDHTRAVAGVAFSPDGRRLASASPDQTIKLWDVSTGQLLLTLRLAAAAVLGVAFSPDGHGLAAAGGDGVARIWDGTPLSQRSDYGQLSHPEEPKGPSEVTPLVPRLSPTQPVVPRAGPPPKSIKKD